MTVAAGLVCHNGVVLAADTEITYIGGSGKRQLSKIFPINRNMGCYLTYAGDPQFTKELVDRLSEKTAGCDDTETIRTIVQSEYRGMTSAEQTALLMSIRKDVREPYKEKIYDYKTFLYHLQADRCFKVETYAAVGIGEEMATAVFDPLYSPLSVRQSAYLVIYAIQKIKRSVQAVGGATELIEILNTDALPFANFGRQEVAQVEADYLWLEEQLKPLLIAFPSEMTKPNFVATLQRFTKELKTYRQKRRRPFSP